MSLTDAASNLITHTNSSLPSILTEYKSSSTQYTRVLARLRDLKKQINEEQCSVRADLLISKLTSAMQSRSKVIGIYKDGCLVAIVSDNVVKPVVECRMSDLYGAGRLKGDVHKENGNMSKSKDGNLNYADENKYNSMQIDNEEDCFADKNYSLRGNCLHKDGNRCSSLTACLDQTVNYYKDFMQKYNSNNEKGDKTHNQNNKLEEKRTDEDENMLNSEGTSEYDRSDKSKRYVNNHKQARYPFEDLPVILVDNELDLYKNLILIKTPTFVKLYKHTYRSFKGFTCYLLLLSNEVNILIDILKIQNDGTAKRCFYNKNIDCENNIENNCKNTIENINCEDNWENINCENNCENINCEDNCENIDYENTNIINNNNYENSDDENNCENINCKNNYINTNNYDNGDTKKNTIADLHHNEEVENKKSNEDFNKTGIKQNLFYRLFTSQAIKVFHCRGCLSFFEREFFKTRCSIALNSKSDVYCDWRIRPLHKAMKDVIYRDIRIIRDDFNAICEDRILSMRNLCVYDRLANKEPLKRILENEKIYKDRNKEEDGNYEIDKKRVNNNCDNMNKDNKMVNNNEYGNINEHNEENDQGYSGLDDLDVYPGFLYTEDEPQWGNITGMFMRLYNISAEQRSLVESILKFRNFIARNSDESVFYVMTDTQAVDLICRRPETKEEFIETLNRMSALVREHMWDFILIIKKHVNAARNSESVNITSDRYEGDSINNELIIERDLDGKLIIERDFNNELIIDEDVDNNEVSLERNFYNNEVSLERDVDNNEVSLERDVDYNEVSLERDVDNNEVSLERNFYNNKVNSERDKTKHIRDDKNISCKFIEDNQNLESKIKYHRKINIDKSNSKTREDNRRENSRDCGLCVDEKINNPKVEDMNLNDKCDGKIQCKKDSQLLTTKSKDDLDKKKNNRSKKRKFKKKTAKKQKENAEM